MTGKTAKRLTAAALALGLSAQTGCLGFINPVDRPPRREIAESLDIPAPFKNRVYVYFVHGLDPLDASNYSGLHDYVRGLGYIKTSYGQPFHAFHFEKEIKKLRAEQPDARIVLVGFSYGAGLVRDVACSLGESGIDVDLLVYLDGVQLENRPLHRPKNVRRVVNVLSFGRPDENKVPEGENYRYDDVWHFATVTHPTTLRMMAKELAVVARRATVTESQVPPTSMPLPPGVPATPLPVPAHAGPPGEWDFLRPDAHGTGVTGAFPIGHAGGIAVPAGEAAPPGTPVGTVRPSPK